MRNGSRATAWGVQPMPAFWLRPNRSPEGQFRSISSVSGKVPWGPSALVFTSFQLRSAESRSSLVFGTLECDVVVMLDGLVGPAGRDCGAVVILRLIITWR